AAGTARTTSTGTGQRSAAGVRMALSADRQASRGGGAGRRRRRGRTSRPIAGRPIVKDSLGHFQTPDESFCRPRGASGTLNNTYLPRWFEGNRRDETLAAHPRPRAGVWAGGGLVEPGRGTRPGRALR